jgi:hypothetical protein
MSWALVPTKHEGSRKRMKGKPASAATIRRNAPSRGTTMVGVVREKLPKARNI